MLVYKAGKQGLNDKEKRNSLIFSPALIVGQYIFHACAKYRTVFVFPYYSTLFYANIAFKSYIPPTFS